MGELAEAMAAIKAQPNRGTPMEVVVSSAESLSLQEHALD